VLQWSATAKTWVAAPGARGGTGLSSYRENGPFAAALIASGINAIAQGEHAQASGNDSVVGGGLDNVAQHWFTTVGGGWSNIAAGLLFGRTTIAGGEWNQALGDWSTIGGGQLNTAGGPLLGRATVAGGWQNQATGDMSTIAGGSQNSAVIGHAAIGGGQYNTISNGAWSSIGGGYSNRVVGVAATVPGGAYNEAAARSSFAAGRRAKAQHTGAFVWADSVDQDFGSSVPNEFAIRAGGGVRIQSDSGISLNAADSPLITRGWDPFAGSAPFGKSGHGRWGLFMEPARLVLGIPGDDVPGREFQVAKYKVDGTFAPLLAVNQAGNVGIGTETPATKLHVVGLSRFDLPLGSVNISTPGGNPGVIAFAPGGHRRDIVFDDLGLRLLVGSSGAAPSVGIDVGEDGTTTVKVLKITGGSDLAEPFEISDHKEVLKGSVMVIDEQNAGQLRLNDEAYDRRVAGVVSGAAGLNPGLTISQAGLSDKGAPVALSGRVYTLADASFGAIRPGDQLTTSSIPGHAMKVSDYQKAQGAILGKAMSSLNEGRGLVLVLVSLQ
jgi:hypothetical protein